jgi:ADP-ribose pyrophosphatase YjhB (NUDIX family)
MDRTILSDRATLQRSVSVAVDVVVFTVVDGRLEVLLTKRPREPYEGRWSLPGGFVREEESADEAAQRALAEKAGVEEVFLEQLYTFSAPERDPRSRVVSVAYYALVSQDKLQDGGSREPRWFPLSMIDELQLAFDHREILQTAIDRIRGKIDYAPIGFQLLPKRFTLTDIQMVYEAVLDRPIDKRNFRTKLLRSGLIREVNEFRKGPHRPARLYEFTHRTF